MPPVDLTAITADSPEAGHAVEIADRIWWVGHHLSDDVFQCHAYLIENGRDSALVDPGSVLTFAHTLRKIEEVLPLDHIRYFICQHQDPDITGALTLIEPMVRREDAVIISHWRTNALLRHLGLGIPLQCIEKMGWSLVLGERTLEFVFTPYLHFPGAFCTFDRSTGTLLSSDLFGGFTEEWRLIARDETYFESMRPFHEHYMPSRDILMHTMLQLQKLPIRLIAPQHGSIIPEHLVDFFIEHLKGIDCGLYLMTRTSTEVQRLSKLNRMLRELMEKMVLNLEFGDIARQLIESASQLLPIRDIDFFVQVGDGDCLCLTSKNRFRSKPCTPPRESNAFLGLDRDHWEQAYHRPILLTRIQEPGESESSPAIIIPLFFAGQRVIRSVSILTLTADVTLDDELEETLFRLSIPLGVAVEREAIHQALDQERQRFYEQSIRDPLTNLYTRSYMRDAVTRILDIHDRNPEDSVALLAFDIDHFKTVNDTFGHQAGDQVLKSVAQIIRASIRAGDIPVRMGGEEFLLIVVDTPLPEVLEIAERVRINVSRLSFDGHMAAHSFTISGGVAMRAAKEPFESLLERSDKALYRAKHTGRNRIEQSFQPPTAPS